MTAYKTPASIKLSDTVLGRFVTEFSKTTLSPLTIAAEFGLNVAAKMSYSRSPSLADSFKKAGEIANDFLPSYSWDTAKTIGQGAAISTAVLGVVVGSTAGILSFVDFNTKAPEVGDTVTAIVANKCPKGNEPRIWRNDHGQNMLIIPKGCKLGE